MPLLIAGSALRLYVTVLLKLEPSSSEIPVNVSVVSSPYAVSPPSVIVSPVVNSFSAPPLILYFVSFALFAFNVTSNFSALYVAVLIALFALTLAFTIPDPWIKMTPFSSQVKLTLPPDTSADFPEYASVTVSPSSNTLPTLTS